MMKKGRCQLVDFPADYDEADRIMLLHAFSVIVRVIGAQNWTSNVFFEAKSKRERGV